MAMAACLPLAAADPPAPFPTGANALFAGHSFFVPVASDFSEIAEANGFADHQADFVFSGGQSGSPGALWANQAKRNEITAHLAEGDVELFGLTVYSEADSAVEDYRRWFDLAIQHNPDTHFYVGHPQTPEGATTPSLLYDELTDELGAATFQIVKQLRAEYPDNPVYFINYGKTASEMKFRYDDGALPDIHALLPEPENQIGADEALFTDNLPGHAGTMLKEVASLSWMSLLYGADVASLDFTNYESDVVGIVEEVVAFNQPFQSMALGDYNGDGLVDAADYTAWRDASGASGSTIAADGNGDGVVDEADYDLWSAQFGGGLAAVIPEPASAYLGWAMTLVIAGGFRRGAHFGRSFTPRPRRASAR